MADNILGKIEVKNGDCLSFVRNIPENSIDAVLTDPPYELGFMNRKWDNTGIAFRKETWAEFYRVLKPGHQLMAFAASKNSHRLACAIEDAGFTIGTTFLYVYGTGFPKGSDISKGIDKKLGKEREVVGFTKGKGGENLNKLSRIDAGDDEAAKGCGAFGFGAKQIDIEIPITKAASNEAKKWEGWNIALKPAYEPVIWAWKGEPTEQARNFLYTSKANKKERKGSKHPTVKSLSAMRELCKVVCPEGGTILDPFAGSGTTGEAAFLEGFKAILIEKEPEYYQDILNRFKEYNVEDSFDWV